MISAVNITKTYKSDSREFVALDHISIRINRGDFVIITGRSGAGKSTFLGVMGGLLRPTSGDVLLTGRSLWSLNERERARLRAEEIGFVFQNASVIRSLTVIENVLLPQMFLPKSGSASGARRAAGLLDVMGLANLAHEYPDKLSGGEKRRVAIASALMNNPTIVLADEPTGDLDTETESRIMDHLLYLKGKGTTIVMVTHNPELTSYANLICRMDCGTIHEIPSQRGSSETSIYNPIAPNQNTGRTLKSN